VYLFDGATGEFQGPCEAHESALESGEFIEPTNSTETAPPAVTTNQVAVYASSAWGVQPDYRGQTIYNQTTGATQEVTEIGPVPSGWATAEPPPSAAKLWADYQVTAQAAMDKTSVTMERIVEGVALGTCALTNADVIAFMTYRKSLRAIISAATGDPTKTLPPRPSYPAGT